MSKRVIIDLGKITTPYCGLAEVALNYVQALETLQQNEIEFIYIVPKALAQVFVQKIAKPIIVPEYFGIKKILFYFTGNKSLLCEMPEADLYHYLHFYSPWGLNGNNASIPILLTIHDFHALERKRSKKRIVERIKDTSYLGFISDFSRGEYKLHFDQNEIDARVIKNGVQIPPSVALAQIEECQNKYGDFLFTLGGLKRKNIHSLIGMIGKYKNSPQFKSKRLLVGGGIKAKYKDELQKLAQSLGVEKDIEYLGSISEQDKYTYMASCEAFVFPSLQEGFGLPVIEAMHFGKPVFCSNKTSLPEVGGELAFYWQHFEPQYMLELLEEGLLKHSGGGNVYIEAEKEYALSFDWKNNAQQYLQYYQDILSVSSG